MHVRLEIERLWYFRTREPAVPISPNSYTSSVIFFSHIFHVHHVVNVDLQNNLRSLRQSQALWAHNLRELWCAGFRHSASLHARVILDGAACRLRELGDVRDVLGVLGDASCCTGCAACSCVVEGRVNEEDDVLVVNGR